VRCFAASGNYLFAGTYGGGIFLSTDNGTNWTEVGAGVQYKNILSLALGRNAMGGTNLFAGCGGGGVFLSIDNGTTWKDVSIPATGTTVNSLATNGANLFAGTFVGAFLSSDNGSKWTAVNNGLKSWNSTTEVRCLAVTGGHLFAGTSGWGVFHSSDDGATWTAVNSGIPAMESTNYIWTLNAQGAEIFAGTNRGVFLSTNYGSSWSAANTGLIDTSVYAIAISGSTLLAGTSKGTIWTRSLSEIITSDLCTGHEIPTSFRLNQNYPNPFNPSTMISFDLPSRSIVSLDVLDLLGRTVAVLVSGDLPAGTHTQQWNAVRVPAGVYLFRLHAGSFIDTKKSILVK